LQDNRLSVDAATASACRELIERASGAESVEEIHGICAQLCAWAGFDSFIYGAEFPVSFVRPQTVIISGFPRDWREHSEAWNYIRVDPTVSHCITRTTPLVWDDIAPLDEQDEALVRQFMGEAADFGLQSGVSFPTHGQRGEAAMLSLVSELSHPQVADRLLAAMPIGQLLVGYVHEAARRVFERDKLVLDRVNLTARERECLLWAAEGKTTADTAQILGISERTVVFHLQNAAQKLDVVNRSQAVARAVSQGYIKPQFD